MGILIVIAKKKKNNKYWASDEMIKDLRSACKRIGLRLTIERRNEKRLKYLIQLSMNIFALPKSKIFFFDPFPIELSKLSTSFSIN